jgi:hypothetical protein
LRTATEDRLIPRSPCQIRGGGEKVPERPVLTIPEVFGLANQPPVRRHRALMLLATFAPLRWARRSHSADAIWTWRSARLASAASTQKLTALW